MRAFVGRMDAFVVLLVCLVAAVVAYDFADEDYNEFVMRDIMAIVDTDDELEAAQRFRRDADDEKKCKSNKNKHHGFYKCCNDDADTDAIHEQYITLKRECHTEVRSRSKREEPAAAALDVFSCGKMNRTKEDYVCVNQCVGQKLNILDAAGNLIETAARQHVVTDLSRTEWQKAAAAEVADKCIAETRAAAAPPAPASTDAPSTADAAAVAAAPTGPASAKCNGASLQFAHCVWREFTRACPAALQSDSKKCVVLREKLQNGDQLDEHSAFGGHHGHHHGRVHHQHRRTFGAGAADDSDEQ